MQVPRLALGVALAALLGVAGLPTNAADTDGHPTGACTVNHVSGAGWDLCWVMDDPRAQGLELTQVYFKGQSVLWRIGAPMALTKYEGNAYGPFKDTFGTPGSAGHPGYGFGKMEIPASKCPRFYSTGTRANNIPDINGNPHYYLCIEQRGGPEAALAVWARYDVGNYRFLQGYRLDNRGHIEPFVRLGGLLIDTGVAATRGEQGMNHFHHLYWRADFDIGAAGNDLFEVWRRVAPAPVDPNLLLVPPSPSPCVGVGTSPAGWCPPGVEGRWVSDPKVAMKWRVADHVDSNIRLNPRGYEFRTLSDASADEFSTSDVFVVQYQGDSAELGYEVPTDPYLGDVPLQGYYFPAAEAVTDPVVWLAQHVYHDTRDEDLGSMSYHETGPFLQPRNMFASNPGELTFP